jgi:hypothetical protein
VSSLVEPSVAGASVSIWAARRGAKKFRVVTSIAGGLVMGGDDLACTAAFYVVLADSLVPCLLRLRTSWKSSSSVGYNCFSLRSSPKMPALSRAFSSLRVTE